MQNLLRCRYIVTLAVAMAFIQSSGQCGDNESHLVYLDQGWSADARQQYYYTPQGSQLIPSDWFLAIEQPYTKELFRADDYLESFEFILGEQNKYNPNGLPLGFVTDTEFGHKGWMGFTCAACHTGEVHYKGKNIRIDGGTTLADVAGFQAALTDAMQSTLAQPGKFKRFADRVLGVNASADSRAQLKKEFSSHLVWMEEWESTSRPAHPTGFGNWDAVNVLMNAINATAIDAPENFRVPHTPVSIPSIWLTDEFDRVLWNGSVHNTTLRKIGEVIIVFGRAKVTATPKGFNFSASADVDKLDSIYAATESLKPPAWPEEILGKIDQEKAARGAKIFEREGCATCHGNKPPYAMTAPNEWNRKFIKITRTPLKDVGTDPAYATYFVSRTASPGITAPMFKGTPFEGQKVIPGAILFLGLLEQITLTEVDAANATPEELAKRLEYRKMPTLPKTRQELDALIESLLVYKAAPLAGIWGSAPYLHNASVPSLYDLLLPPEQRTKQFYLGNREFDPVKVGYISDPGKERYRFDTTVPGFSNAGHTYGTDITEDERWDLLEYLKSL